MQSTTTRTIHLSFKDWVGSPCHIRGPPTLVAFGQPLAAAAAIRLIARGAQPPVRNNQLAAALKRGVTSHVLEKVRDPNLSQSEISSSGSSSCEIPFYRVAIQSSSNENR